MTVNKLKQTSVLAVKQMQVELDKEPTDPFAEVECLHYDGRHYNLIHNNSQLYPDGIPDDISYWLNMASQYKGSILTLFCGAGRIAIPLAEKGYQVTGLDISGSMLEEARKRSSQVRWVKADAENFDLNQKFSLIIIPLNSIAHLLELEALESCLKCIRNHLEPNGRVIIHFENFCSPDNLDFFSSKVRQLYSVYTDPEGKGTMIVTCEAELNLFEQICKLKLFFKLLGQTEEVCEDVILRFYSAKEFETLLKYNGFVVEQRFGDCDQTPFTPQSPQHILVCHPRK